jgi:hypothetical protein
LPDYERLCQLKFKLYLSSKCFVYLNLQPVSFNFPFNHIVSFFTTIKTKSLKRDQENDKFIQNHNGIQMPSHIFTQLTAAFETFTNIFIEDVLFTLATLEDTVIP